MEFVLRFVAGGLVIALAPIVANRYGGSIAGLILLFPIVTLTGFGFIALRSGASTMQAAAAGSLKTLPAVLVFLAGVYFGARLGLPASGALGAGLAAWLIVAAMLLGAKVVR